MKRRETLLLFSAGLGSGLTTSAWADDRFPNRPIRVVMPYAPGSVGDLMARSIQDAVASALGQPMFIDHRAGAGGAIGAREVALAAPDGYTLLFGNNGPNAIGPQLNQNSGYDPIKDFAPVVLVAVVPLILSINPSVPAKNLREFVDFARRESGLDYGTVGVGSFGYLATEVFAKSANLKLTHVPYKSSGQVILGLIAGEIKMSISAPSESLFANARAGKVRIIGVSSPQPTPLAPGVLPIVEVVPGFVMEGWFGLFAPARTPAPVVSRIAEAVRGALSSEDLKRKFIEYGFIAGGKTSGEFREFVFDEVARWGRVIREHKLRLE